ncbi:hypothetical protein [Chitinophaga sp.]|uniref:hypothetical protein n=1 Tax=Chitinophaga sp. TaxID=1869181 RepID=UPI0026116DD6|nr:hypothetical protein [uncultured Chitinophaga sp.]
MNEQVSQLGEEFDIPSVTRRQLLPLWIKIFSWIFVFVGLLSLLCLFLAALGVPVSLSVFGLETTDGLSPTGLIVISMFLLKAIVSIGLLGMQKWAVELALADAVLGIIVCLTTMVAGVWDGNLTIRLELVLLGLYLWKMLKIRNDWKNSPQ